MAKIKVTFRVWDNEVVAVFPEERWDSTGTFITCYTHIGQHAACSRDYTPDTRLATPEEYRELLVELRSIGYDNLQIIKRYTRRRAA